MSALISPPCPLKNASAAEKITVRGYRIDHSRLQTGSNRLQVRPNARRITGLDMVREPIVLGGTANARVHSFARRVPFAAGAAGLRAEVATLDAAIATNLKEVGYGG